MKFITTQTIALFVAIAFGSSFLYASDDGLQDTDPIFGKWKVIKWSIGEQEFDTHIGSMVAFTANGKLATFDREDRPLGASRFEIEGNGEVRKLRIDSVLGDHVKGKNRPLTGVFKIERKSLMRPQLVICINPFATEAPSSFESKECDGGNLITLEAID